MEPTRILHIVNNLNRGGMESRIMDLYRNINRDLFQFDFYIQSGNSGAFDSEIEQLGGRLYYSLKTRNNNIPNFREFRTFLLKHEHYRLVYAYNQWAGFYLKEAKKCGVPYRIAYSRTSLQKKTAKNIIKNLVKYNVNTYATYRFAVSKKAAIWLFGKKRTNNGDVIVWPNAIDTKKYAYLNSVRKEVREELNLGDSFTVIHVGNIRPEKNHRYLLQVFFEIKKLHDDSKLILIGGGDIDTVIHQNKHFNNMDSIIHLGVRTDVNRLLQAGDVFIFPSIYEGFPGAVIEAEAAGLNCLVSNTITDEVLLTNHIESLSIDLPPNVWAEKALKPKNDKRSSSWREVFNAGYDIKELAERTESFYKSLKL